jgi:hypothetical protein
MSCSTATQRMCRRAPRSIVAKVPLTDYEMAIYRRSPETFFRVVKDLSKKIDQPMDAYDFFYETYSRSSKEKLLGFMTGWPDVEGMRSLSQQEPVKRYCARMAEGMSARFGPRPPFGIT